MLSSNRFACVLLLSGAVSFSACARGSARPDDSDSSCADDSCETADGGGRNGGALGKFALREDFTGPCTKAKGSIDVNIGNTAETTVRALYCQVNGREADAATIQTWVTKLLDDGFTRRGDVARRFCLDAGRSCTFTYSDPWLAQEDLTDTCTRKTERDMGAVLMFFSDCPGNINCGASWANTHPLGYSSPHVIYGNAEGDSDYYNPRNSGFWRRELLDARWAGLQFVLLNVYGPDIQESTGVMSHLADGLDEIDGIQVALFDDTWIWGRGTNTSGIWGRNIGAPFTSVPNLDDTNAAAQTIYDAKWKPFFSAIPQERWYTRDGKPLIYFYNAGTFSDKAAQSAAVLSRMKQLFLADFGVEPFLVVDRAFFVGENRDQNAAANGRFTWNAGACPPGFESAFYCRATSSETMGSVRIDHSMVRWDSKNRDHQGTEEGGIATEYDRIIKGPEYLQEFLIASADADVAVIATWNDLGEGTGIHRNYDYFHKGEWLEPNAFMSLIRQSQCSN